MKREDCRVGMVVWEPEWQIRAVVIKCNPKNARVKTLEAIGGKTRGSAPGSTWNIPYKLLEPWVDTKAPAFMAMKSFEQPGNAGIKAYFANAGKASDPVDFPEGSPEWHVMKAICELWRRLDEEGQTAALRRHYSFLINKLFSALGREVSQRAAEEWETGNIKEEAV
jgi:hypothetical protein